MKKHDFAAILRLPCDESLKSPADNLEVLVDARPLQQIALQSVKDSLSTRLSKTAQNALKALHSTKRRFPARRSLRATQHSASPRCVQCKVFDKDQCMLHLYNQGHAAASYSAQSAD